MPWSPHGTTTAAVIIDSSMQWYNTLSGGIIVKSDHIPIALSESSPTI